jgi:DNA-binding NarL/FixJ family response regulator
MDTDALGNDGGTAPSPIRVFLLDDHEIVRRGVRDLLETNEDIVVVGEAGSAEEARNRIPGAAPHVAVLDVQLGDGTGIEVCRDIRSANPEISCVMLTSFADDQALLDSVMAGASGYVLKQIRGSELIDSIRTVAGGGSLLDGATVERMMQRLRGGDTGAGGDPRLANLTPQERRILDLLAEGLTNRQIGERMFLAEKTVKNYVSNLLMKLGMKRRTEAAVYAARHLDGQDQSG